MTSSVRTRSVIPTAGDANTRGAPPLSISREDLDGMIRAVEVSFVKMAECVVSPGWRLTLAGTDAPSLHYCVRGTGILTTDRWPPVELRPHTLTILPRNTSFSLSQGQTSASRTATGFIHQAEPGSIRRFVAGPNEPELILVCGYFRALYGLTTDLFEPLQAPIVEGFGEEDRIDSKLEEAVDELVSQEIGTGAMAAGLLKLVLIAILRRSVVSRQTWTERFALLNDPQISRALSEMTARPAANHTVQSLSQVAGLSRSAFMARFAQVFGDAPMATLRQLRMRHAAALLSTKALSIDQVARAAGYENRSSFSRAFRKIYGTDPTEYRHRHEIAEGEAFTSK